MQYAIPILVFPTAHECKTPCKTLPKSNESTLTPMLSRLEAIHSAPGSGMDCYTAAPNFDIKISHVSPFVFKRGRKVRRKESKSHAEDSRRRCTKTVFFHAKTGTVGHKICKTRNNLVFWQACDQAIACISENRDLLFQSILWPPCKRDVGGLLWGQSTSRGNQVI